jgi:hypothetical protein
MVKLRMMVEGWESTSDQNYTLSTKQSLTAYGEAELVIQIFGNGQNVSFDNFNSFFLSEQIPDGWNPPAKAYTNFKLLLTSLT